jgi:hypothetical protein
VGTPGYNGVKEGQLPPKKLAQYAALQSLALLGCWIWFGALWGIAFFNYGLGDMQWWVLVAAACAGLYGLRPNLERAIDTAWLQGVKNSNMLAERVAQLRPIKRRITVLFSAAVVVLFLAGVLLWIGLSVVTTGLVAS